MRKIFGPVRRKCCPNISGNTHNLLKKFIWYLSKDSNTGFKIKLDVRDLYDLTKWENYMINEYEHENFMKLKGMDNFKLNQTIEKIEELGRKVEDMMDNRKDMKSKLDSFEQKLEIILDLLKNGTPIENNTKAFVVKPQEPEKKPTPIESAEKPSSFDRKLVSVSKKMVNKLSKNFKYPKSVIQRSQVPDDKISWDVLFPEYKPEDYTSPNILSHSSADEDILSYPIASRPEISFNCYDISINVDRRSCLGKYKVIDGLPINPQGRTGMKGRGALKHWGPNHSILAVITRWDFASGDKKAIELLVMQNEVDWKIPEILVDNPQSNNKIDVYFCDKFFEIENTSKYNRQLKELIATKTIITSYYKDSKYNTDNAWIEVTIVNYHDETGTIINDLPLRVFDIDSKIAWKRLQEEIQPNDDNLNDALRKVHNKYMTRI